MGAAMMPLMVAAAGTVMSSMMAPKQQAQAPAPTPSAPTAMPTADAAAVAAARKKSMMEQAARSGRSSTIMTDSTDKLGG